MNVVSLFSGIGGFDLGLEHVGFQIVAQVENDPFCRRVLEVRWPGVPRFGNIRTVALAPETGLEQFERVDLLCGGFPCQGLSPAGKRGGLADPRSQLFYEFVRIAQALAPAWGLVENVPGLFSSHRGRDFALVLQGLRECWPSVGWRILDSQYFGVPQRRRRVFFVGGPTTDGVASVLALFEGGGGDSAAGREARAEIAGPLGGGAYGTGRRTDDDPNLMMIRATGRGYWNDDGLAGLRGHPGTSAENIIAATLNSGGNNGGFRTEPGEHLVSDALTRRGIPLIRELSHRGANQVGIRDATSYPVSATQDVVSVSGIRRLTCLECERLQGFPDGWTCLCQPVAAYAADPDAAALACRCPDSPRYGALGNAVTVPVIEWLGYRLMTALTA